MLVCCVCCVLWLGGADNCFGGFLPGVCVFNCVWSRNLKRVSLGTIWVVAPEYTINAATNSLAFIRISEWYIKFTWSVALGHKSDYVASCYSFSKLSGIAQFRSWKNFDRDLNASCKILYLLVLILVPRFMDTRENLKYYAGILNFLEWMLG